ncbi:hypothetical protein [Yersinia aleksiciae]|uniref:Uncharacterized protein n=1 Tax=Yersinia aleksiciae TaxID=263819 RepID=A0ABN4HFT0_YERAE|nr:hypothetical protein [Yersinia aleksiciae]AKP34680.1 hypothetical protein ACZ76_14660 [Yersinia aleksiciae]CFQ47499.1 Uncharacterised protein [Yersinia aleksiciae]
MNNIEEFIGQSRIKEISRGSAPLIGEKERLALTAMYWHQEHQAAVEAFQETGRNLLLAQEQITGLLAQLEAAQKERDEFRLAFQQNEQAKQELFAQKDLLITASLNISRRAEKAEAELSAANAKPKPISFDELADRVQFVTGSIRMSFDPLNCKGHQIVPFMNFNSLLRIVEMYRTTETYHLAGVVMRPQFEKPLERCAAARDGECHHKDCPQLRDNEPMATGRHCPIDNWDDE